MPLFVEELTKAVLESEQLHDTGDRYVLDQPTQELAIPTTLQASLMACVDRLGSAREVLQIGAAIGRIFLRSPGRRRWPSGRGPAGRADPAH